MFQDHERIRRIQVALRGAGLDAMVCGLPSHVLLLTGYCPVVGTAVAVVTEGGQVAVVAPEDERELAETGWADDLRTFQPGSLETLGDASSTIIGPLQDVARTLGIERGRIGHDGGESYQPAVYAAVHLYGNVTGELLHRALPHASLVPADDLLTSLDSVKTPAELERIRTACRVAEHAFDSGMGQLEPEMTELEAAACFRRPLCTWHEGAPAAQRMDGFTFCMSGPNAAEAYAAYQRSRTRRLRPGDLVLVHCNSHVDGYWTDITRTYCMGQPDARQHRMYEAVFAARKSALAAARPGASGADVDHAAGAVMEAHGFAEQFKHPTGHGVGFAAINHNARPRLHPKSRDLLEAGSVFNVEPGIYIDGYGGMRHCDMVAVGEAGAEVLTSFQGSVDHSSVRVTAGSVWT